MRLTRPLLLLLALVLASVGWLWLPDPAFVVPGPTADAVSSPRALLGVFAGPMLVVLAPAVLRAWGSCGGPALACAGRYLLGLEREQEALQAHHGLAAAAGGGVWGGLALGLLGGVAMFLLLGRSQGAGPAFAPAELARLVSWALLVPMVAVGLGRLVLGAAADHAALRAGAAERRAFAPRDDLVLLLFLLPPLMSFLVIVLPLPS